MFVDKVLVSVNAGNGGNGIVSFRHEKFVDKGGPDGGDGGDGGDVVLIASRNQDTLANFRYQRTLKAENGQNGSKQKKHGKSGSDLDVLVPVGTIVTDEDNNLLADLQTDGQRAVIAYGGKGGFGNAHFVSSVRQSPRIAEKGELGETFKATLELKMIADVGLVGLPNAGKSTLLSVISNARPEIANYPFTTTSPNLGVVDIDKNTSLLFADIPGLIEGASAGKGLGDEFLRHIERTKVLVHLIDIYTESVIKAYKTVQQELKDYKIDLTGKPQVIVLTKIEGLDNEIINDRLKELKQQIPKTVPIMAISSKSKQNINELLYEIKKITSKKKAKSIKPQEETIPVYRLEPESLPWQIIKREDTWLIRGRKIERFAARTDFNNEEGVRRLRDIMKKTGITRELERRGAEKGQNLHIGKLGSLEY